MTPYRRDAAGLGRRARNVPTALWVVYMAGVVYASLFAASASLHYHAYEASRLDLGNMVQAIWSTAHGHFLEITTLTGDQATRLSAHVDPFLALLVPLWWAWPSPVMLLVAQALIVSAGVVPVYRLAEKHLRDRRAGLAFAAAYLAYPATQYNAYTPDVGFHSVSLAVPLLLFAIWFLDEERLLPFAVCALLAAATKEEIPAAIGCLGIWYAVGKGHRYAGVAVAVIGLAATLVNFELVVPHFAIGGYDPYLDRYEDVGGTPGGILVHAFTDPGSLVHAVATWHKLLYVVFLLAPFLGLSLLEPLLLLGAAPDLAVNLLSSKPEQTSIHYQYTAGIVPFVVAAAILGAGRIGHRARWLAPAAAVGAVCAALLSSPLGTLPRDVRTLVGPDPLRDAKAQAVRRIPAGVPVTASKHLAAYLSDRTTIYVFPVVRTAQWAVLDVDDPLASPQAYRRAVASIDSSASWQLVFSSHGVQVLRRRPD